MSNITGDNNEANFSSGNSGEEVEEEVVQQKLHPIIDNIGRDDVSTSVAANNSNSIQHQQPLNSLKKKRNLPGTPDPNAEVIALSPTTLMATNRFVCEICNKGFQRDQNLQLHRRGHNLPWKLRQRTTTEVKKRVYICPEPTCVHHNPARALGDLTGIKKHFSRKHGEKKWKCDKCSKKYAVQSDWKAHQKTCGTREYKCDCGTIFSRRDSFITHRAFCDALAEENNKVNQGLINNNNIGSSNIQSQMPDLMQSISTSTTNVNTSMGISEFNSFDPMNPNRPFPQELIPMPFKPMNISAEGMFSTSSGTLFGGPKVNNNSNNISTSSSNLQLSSNNSSSTLNYLQDNKNGSQISGSAHMSATALLQKAAQMGATASNSTINSPMMQKNFVSSMAGPDQMSSSIRQNYQPNSAIQQQQHNSLYGHFQPQQVLSEHSNMNGINSNQLLSKNPQEISHFFNAHLTSNVMNEMGAFGQMVMGSSSDESHRETVDFLGINGGSRPENWREQQVLQQKLMMELEAKRQQSLPMMNPFQQQLPHGDSGNEKSIWDV